MMSGIKASLIRLGTLHPHLRPHVRAILANELAETFLTRNKRAASRGTLVNPYKLLNSKDMAYVVENAGPDTEHCYVDGEASGSEVRRCIQQVYADERRRLLSMSPREAWADFSTLHDWMQDALLRTNPDLKAGLDFYTQSK